MTTRPADCDALRALLASTAPGSTDIERVIAAHIAACPTCIARERELALLLDEYRKSAPPALPTDLEERLIARFCRTHHPQSS
jgi:hypothetical protein